MVITTGGTIAQRSDRWGVAHPGASSDPLLAAASGVGATVRHRRVLDKASKDMRPRDWQVLAEAVAAEIAAGVAGVVVLHGTDTLHYTSAALSFMLTDPGVPVVLTGSMRPGGDPGTDALANVRDAVRVAAHADLGEVVVVFSADAPRTHGLVLRGSRTRKAHSHALDAFVPVGFPPLGRVYGDRVELAPFGRARGHGPGAAVLRTRLEDRVALVKVTPATTSPQLSALLGHVRGVVVEGTGAGHVPGELVAPLREFAASGGVVVMATQTERGGERLGGYSSDLDAATVRGLVGAGTLTPETALVKLMWVLGQGGGSAQLAENLALELDDAPE